MKLKPTSKILFSLFFLSILTTGFSFADTNQLLRRGSDDNQDDDRRPSNPQPSPNSISIPAGTNVQLSLGNERIEPRFKIERKQKSRRGVISEDKFTSSIKLPVPSLNLGISSNTDARNGDVVLTFSKANTPYASCTLDFSSIRRYRYGTRAEYKVEYESKVKKGSINTRAKKSSCDTDLATAGEQSGLPNLQAGDSYLIEVNGISLFSGNL